jgi:hypothetical protein
VGHHSGPVAHPGKENTPYPSHVGRRGRTSSPPHTMGHTYHQPGKNTQREWKRREITRTHPPRRITNTIEPGREKYSQPPMKERGRTPTPPTNHGAKAPPSGWDRKRKHCHTHPEKNHAHQHLVGVRNMTNKEPPIPQGCRGNTNQNTHTGPPGAGDIHKAYILYKPHIYKTHCTQQDTSHHGYL